MSSALWLLEAKAFAEEDRTPAATTIKYWLKPGSYVIGKPKHSEIAIDEDKSISRKHGGLVVPAAGEREDDGPYVLLTDSSKYGTVVSRDGSFDESKVEKVASGGAPARVDSGCMLKFGFKSPFRVVQQDWVLYLSSAQRESADAADLAAVEAAAAATGLPLTDELPDHPGTRMLALGGSPLIVDGPLLLGLLRGYPAVGANWLLEWQQQKVWCNTRPQEEGYTVQMQYRSSDGRLKALPPGAGATALAAARDSQLLAGRPLLWLPPARDAALQEAAAALGAGNHNVAASGRASAAAKEEGAVLVRGSEEDHMPASYSHLPWTTPDLLIAGILEGNMGAAVHQPVAPPDTTTPSSKKGRGRGKAPGSRSASAKKGRGRGKAAAAAAAEEEQHESGSETDVSEDLSHLKDTQRVLAKDERAAPTAAAAAPGAAEQQEEQPQAQHEEEQPASAARQRGKKSAAAALPAAAASAEAAAAAGKATTGGRKRRAPEPEEQQEQQAAAPSPTPAKKQRQAAPAAATAVVPLAAAVMPAADGWHNRGAGHPQPPGAADEQASPDGRAPAVPAAAAGVAASAAKPTSAAGRRAARRGGGPPADGAAAAAAAAAEGAAEAVEGEEELEEVEVEEDGPTRVCYTSLIVPAPPPPAAPSSGADDGPNFKAFRKAGSAAVAAAAAPRAVIGFDAQPYEELNQPSAEAFLKAEAERRRRKAQADELFAANIKAKKAPQLPDPDGDSLPSKGRGRGGGRGGAKMAAAAAPAGQKSILGFLPPAGRGRGGRGGRGGGGGK